MNDDKECFQYLKKLKLKFKTFYFEFILNLKRFILN